MSLTRIRSTIAALKVNIEKNKNKNPKLARRYESDLRRAEYYENLLRDESPNKKKVEKHLIDSLKTLFSTTYNAQNTMSFFEQLVTYLKSKP